MQSPAPIAILLSTYNGERYLTAQLDSLLAQSCRGWCLFIRDDGSKDATCAIIDTYTRRHPARIRRLDDRAGNLGSGRSFMALLAAVEADYYLFCDQDDVWLPEKVERLYRKMRQCEQAQGNRPLGVFSDLRVVDARLRTIDPSLWAYSGIDPRNCRDPYRMILYGCPLFGCATLFNRAARERLLPYPGWKYHDLWTALVLAGVGRLDYLPEPTILYRQHGANVTGAHGAIDRQHYLRRLARLGETLADQRAKLRAFRQLPYAVSIPKIVGMKLLKCLKTLLKDPDHGKPDGSH